MIMDELLFFVLMGFVWVMLVFLVCYVYGGCDSVVFCGWVDVVGVDYWVIC